MSEIRLALKEAADAAGLNTHIVMDAGRTQIAAGTYFFSHFLLLLSGSRTVLALGPAPGVISHLFSLTQLTVSLVNKVTGSLKLY